jgi:hypothetical protein
VAGETRTPARGEDEREKKKRQKVRGAEVTESSIEHSNMPGSEKTNLHFVP